MPYINGGGAGGGAISGVVVTGSAVAGDVPVASSAIAGAWAFTSGHEIGYDQITGNVTVASTTEATGTTIITCAAHVFDGAAVLATFFSPAVSVGPTAGEFVAVSLFEGATQITELCTIQGPAAGTLVSPVVGKFRFTPTAASHTYTITAFKSGASVSTIEAGAGGTGANPPCFVQFTKV